MSSVTAWTGRMTTYIVWDWAADCSRLAILRWQRFCLQNCCASDWQRMFECRQNAVVWHGRRRRADSRQPGNPGRCRTRIGSRNLEHDTLPHRKPLQQLAEHRRNMNASPGARHEPGGSVLNWLQAARQFVSDAVAQRVTLTVVQATDNKGLDHRLRGVFRRALANLSVHTMYRPTLSLFDHWNATCPKNTSLRQTEQKQDVPLHSAPSINGLDSVEETLDFLLYAHLQCIWTVYNKSMKFIYRKKSVLKQTCYMPYIYSQPHNILMHIKYLLPVVWWLGNWVSVCLSVCSSRSCIVSKRLKIRP